MIFVDELARHRTPWHGGLSCHLVSDQSREELESFASSIGIPIHWLQRPFGDAHFDLSPRLRRKALEAGAVRADRKQIVLALQRYRIRNPQLFPGVE